jgi:hypothetical protein
VGPALRATARQGAVLLLFLALALLATRPLARDLRGQMPVGPDPLIDLWTLHWLTGHALEPAQLFHGNVFHPFSHAALHSDLSLGTAVLVLPLRPFVSDPVALYNAGLLLALAFGGWAFCRLVEALTGRLSAGLLSGVLAAFGSHQLYHVYHLNLLSVGWLALLLLGLHRLAERPGPGPALLAGVSFALSALSSGYYAVAGVLLALAFAAARARRLLAGRALAWSAAAALLAAVLVWPYARAFLALREESGLRRPVGMSVSMAFRPAHDLGSRAFAYSGLLGARGERLFPGLLALALAGAALARRRPEAGFYAGATALLLLVSLGPRLELGERSLALPYGLLFRLGPLDSMRHPYTFAAVGTFTLAVLAGLGWAGLRLSDRRGAGAAVVALAVLETLGPPVRVRAVPPGLPAAYERLRQLPPGPLVELPPSLPEAMLWAARHGRPVVNGIGAFAPPESLRLDHVVRRQWLRRPPPRVDGSAPDRLLRETFGARYVVLDTRRPVRRRLAQAFGRSPGFRLVEAFPDGLCLYELLPRGPAPPWTTAGAVVQ